MLGVAKAPAVHQLQQSTSGHSDQSKAAESVTSIESELAFDAILREVSQQVSLPHYCCFLWSIPLFAAKICNFLCAQIDPEYEDLDDGQLQNDSHLPKPDLNRLGNDLSATPEIMKTLDVDKMIQEANAQIDGIIKDLDRLDMADTVSSDSETVNSNVHINDVENELDTESKTDYLGTPQKQGMQIRVSMAESTVGMSANPDWIVSLEDLNTMEMLKGYIHHEPIGAQELHSPLYVDGPPAIPMAMENQIETKENQLTQCNPDKVKEKGNVMEKEAGKGAVKY